jgi:hypothetical protein
MTVVNTRLDKIGERCDNTVAKINEVAVAIAAMSATGATVLEHLKRINGSVADHERRFPELMDRISTIEQTAEVFRLETRAAQATSIAVQKAGDEATAKLAAKYRIWLAPTVKTLITITATILGILILRFGPEILAAMKAR